MLGCLQQLLFPILSGIIQVCPLSGTLFVFVAHPLLRMFQRPMSLSIVRACADNIGAALRRLSVLAMLATICADF